MVRLTIVTSVLNGEPYLGAMLASVPRHDAVEHIAIDAGSSDGTLERLRTTPGLRLIEAPGLPLYAAWNLGVERAQGDAVIFLNADDLLPPGAVTAWLDALAIHPKAELLLGRAEAFRQVGGAMPQSLVRYVAPSATGLDLATLALGAPIINAKAFRRGLFERLGGFDTRYRFAADREFLLRATLAAPSPRHVMLDRMVYRYRIHDGSMTLAPSPRRRAEMAAEHRRIARSFARRPDLGREAGRVVRAWLARETAVQLATSAVTGDLRSAVCAGLSAAAGLPETMAGLWRARALRKGCVAALAGRGGAG